MGLAPLDPITAQLFRRTLMKLGISLPLSDIQGESATVCDFAQAAESLGYHHLAAPDHGNCGTYADIFRGKRRIFPC